MQNLSSYLKMEKINKKVVIYQLYVDIYNYLDQKIFICDEIEENLFTNIRIIKCGKEIYKSKCVAELRTKLTLKEIKEHIVNPNLEKSNLSAIITLKNPPTLYPTREKNSKIEYLSEKYLSDVINFLERRPTEKEVTYLIKNQKQYYLNVIPLYFDRSPNPKEIEYITQKQNKNLKNLEKLLALPRWKMQLGLHCSSMLADPSELKDFVYTSAEEIKLRSHRPIYISKDFLNSLGEKYGQLAHDYDSHIDKKMVLCGEKEITEEIRMHIKEKLEKQSVKEFCERSRKIFLNLQEQYLQNNISMNPVTKKEFEFMSNEQKVSKLQFNQ